MASGNFLMALSVLYRNSQKYFDHVLEGSDIGSGQLLCLFYIYENEGCSLSEVSKITEIDKGTTTKNIQKLVNAGYIEIRVDEEDKRLKRMYVSHKGNELMNKLYIQRSTFQSQVFQGIPFATFENQLMQACDNCRNLFPEEETEVKIGGLQKMTLLDYPGNIACTIFTSSCNFKCPYCHNKELVFVPDYYDYISEDSVFQFLNHRKGKLDGVVVSGGEPLLQKGILNFLKKIKDMGYKVKLDTNGLLHEKLVEVIDSGYVDYVAMDVKNVERKYAETIGLAPMSFMYTDIQKSIDYLKEHHVDYEFRCTVVKDFHTKEDILTVAKDLQDSPFYLQQFQSTPNNIQPNLLGYTDAELYDIYLSAKQINPTTYIRGIKEVQSCIKS